MTFCLIITRLSDIELKIIKSTPMQEFCPSYNIHSFLGVGKLPDLTSTSEFGALFVAPSETPLLRND